MLSSRDEKIATEFKNRLTDLLPVLEMHVFGSRARGDAAPDSDLDIFIKVTSCTSSQRQAINELAWEIGFEMDRIISPFVATPDHLEHGPLGASPLLTQIEQADFPLVRFGRWPNGARSAFNVTGDIDALTSAGEEAGTRSSLSGQPQAMGHHICDVHGRQQRQFPRAQ